MDTRKLMMRFAQESSLDELIECLEGAINEYKQSIPSEKADNFRKLCMAASIVLAKRLLEEDPSGQRIMQRNDEMDKMDKRLEDEEDKSRNPFSRFGGLGND